MRPNLSLLLLPLALACTVENKLDSKPGAGEDSAAPEDTAPPADADGDGYSVEGDCDDADAGVNPGADEVCDEVDNDCDGSVDDGVTAAWHLDSDGDGYGDGGAGIDACEPPTSDPAWVLDATDCDDGDAGAYPGAPEVCDDADDDCDGAVDEDLPLSTWYADADSDGHGDPATGAGACRQPAGAVASGDDCDDADARVSPNAYEICNGIDDDCDGLTDSGAADALPFHLDGDGDGYGDPDSSIEACDQPAGASENGDDCDDAAAAVNPGADEICDEVDNDCDGAVDEDAIDQGAWYADGDGDGYGDPDSSVEGCDQPAGAVAGGDDCDDSDAGVNPDAAETWYDGADGDCAGDSDYDADQDGDDADDYGGTDCDDADPAIRDGAGCRATCTSPDEGDLADFDPKGAVDIAFGPDCRAYISTIVSGTDSVYVVESGGLYTTLSGAEDLDINSVALDPVTSDVVAGYSSPDAALGIGNGSSIDLHATGVYNVGALWDNTGYYEPYLNMCVGSVAVDAAGCIWAPNFSGPGTLDCVDVADASVTTVATFAGRLESVALDPDERVYVSEGAVIHEVDPSDGSTAVFYTASDPVLDFVFDIDGTMYAETTAGELLRVSADGGTTEILDYVDGQGRLAIAPDGYLVRIAPKPLGDATYQRWSLP